MHNLTLNGYIKTFRNVLKGPLIKSIDNVIYKEDSNFEIAGTINTDGSNLIDKRNRSVKQFFFKEENIGHSVAKRIIYNEIVRGVKKIVDSYTNQTPFIDLIKPEFSFNFLKYQDTDEGHYEWHTDHHSKHAPRTLTCIIGLNNSYEGGTLSVINDNTSLHLKRSEGVIFPSNFCFPHKVYPVTKGERRVLVAWIS